MLTAVNPKMIQEQAANSSYAAAEDLLRQEMGQVDTNYPEAGDTGIIDLLNFATGFPAHQKKIAIEQLIRALAYRFRLQEKVFVITHEAGFGERVRSSSRAAGSNDRAVFLGLVQTCGPSTHIYTSWRFEPYSCC